MRPRIAAWGMIPTPFSGPDGALDLASMRRVIGQYAADGCDGVVVLGVIGEPATLTPPERLAACESAIATEVPVIVGALVGGPDGVLDDIRDVVAPCAASLSGVMVPVLHTGADDLSRWLDTVHERSGLPVLLQDLPRATGIEVKAEVLADVVLARPWVVGVKCEAPPTYERIAYFAERGVRGLMSGFGGLGLIADLAAGAASVAIGITVPAPVVETARHWTAGDDETARRCLGAWAPRIHLETQEGPSIAIRKQHLLRRGLLADASVRDPTRPWHPAWERLSVAVGA